MVRKRGRDPLLLSPCRWSRPQRPPPPLARHAPCGRCSRGIVIAAEMRFRLSVARDRCRSSRTITCRVVSRSRQLLGSTCPRGRALPTEVGDAGGGTSGTARVGKVPSPTTYSPPAQRSFHSFLSQGCGDGTSLRLRLLFLIYSKTTSGPPTNHRASSYHIKKNEDPAQASRRDKCGVGL